MSTCSKCGAEAPEKAKFCKACGGSLAAGASSLNDKKARVTGGERSWVKPAVIAAVVVLVVVGAWAGKGMVMAKKMGGRPMFAPLRDASFRLSHTEAVKNEGGVVRIPVASVVDGKAHFYSYASNGKTISFFVMKTADGSIQTAYDACMACNHAKLGYRQEGELVACNNCGMGFKPSDIGKETGGCNPIALNKTVDGQMIVVKVSDIEAGAQYF